jgi:hypothetical protein
MWTQPIPVRRKRQADDWQRTDGGVWLPRAGDVPLRGAGMVRRGMGFGFEPAGCCCEVPGNCGPYGPFLYDSSSQVVLFSFSGLDELDNMCRELNGDFESDKRTEWLGTENCNVTWSYQYGSYPTCSVRFEIFNTGSRRLWINAIAFTGKTFYYILNESTTARYVNTDGSTWTLSSSDTACGANKSTAIVTIYDA